VLEEFGNVIAPGGAGVVIASQSGHRLPALTAEQKQGWRRRPPTSLLALPMLQPDQVSGLAARLPNLEAREIRCG
jgi:hypothetical protein